VRKSAFAATCFAIAALADIAASGVHAQDFPTRPVSLMMPYAAGGPGDTITRLIGQGMGKVLNQQFVVENTAGAGGTIGTAKVAASAPDGYSLLVMHVGHAANTALYRNLRYDAIADFEPIGMIAESPMAFVAKKDFPASRFNEFIAYVQNHSTSVSYGHAGVGSASHLCGLLFFDAIDTTVTSIPYKGTAPALSDLMGGQFDFMCDQTVNVFKSVQAGLIKAYAVITKARLSVLPDLPTANETGLPGFAFTNWFALYAPKGTPKSVIDKLSEALQVALQDPDLKSKLAVTGAEAVSPDRARPEVLRALLKAEIDKWGPIIRKAGTYAD
jgi:tripartite-type tricarboxylate transporter receptor subunit TctC